MDDTLYIRRIEIKKLWNVANIDWELGPSVNILAGGNGSGKSTVLRCISEMFAVGHLSDRCGSRIESIRITFSDGRVVDSDHPFDPSEFRVSVISTFDIHLPAAEAVRQLTDGNVSSSLDWEIYRLQNQYLSYQLEVGRKVIHTLQKGGDPSDVEAMMAPKTLFFDIIDTLFASTGKKIVRESDHLLFVTKNGTRIPPYFLSSGEKQMLIILVNVLVQFGKDYIMILDEPEISLHFDWQRRMIEDLFMLNPRLQLILATHSPAVVMNGWTDRVTEIGDIVSAVQ